jgi:hypothetical protein
MVAVLWEWVLEKKLQPHSGSSSGGTLTFVMSCWFPRQLQSSEKMEIEVVKCHKVCCSYQDSDTVHE